MSLILALESGGTHTRALAVGLDGTVLAYAETGGGNPQHCPDSVANVRGALAAVLERAGRRAEEVVGLAAGLAGLDRAEDHTWAETHTALPGLDCPRLHVNDAVVAHAGALRGGPGIIAVSGTGSIVFGVTESGEPIRNYDFRQYAPSGARFVAGEAVYGILLGEDGPEDADLVAAVLRYWEVPDRPALTRLASRGFGPDWPEAVARLGRLAPVVTAAAQSGSSLAREACRRAARVLGQGIRLVGACFAGPTVPVVLVGSVACSPAVRAPLEAELDRAAPGRFLFPEPVLSPVAGAALLALERAGVVVDQGVVDRLREGNAAR